ncbi:MAG: glutamate formimidoyltransferase [Bdellovibrionota bacterium]
MLIECVPNISEGRDLTVLDEICAAITRVPGVRLLHVDRGIDANRTVLTFAGSPGAISDAAFEMYRVAAETINMERHHGAHPRIGAVDVCPFVPLDGATLEDCVGLARALGERVAASLKLPVYLYEAAASLPERMNLANIRRGEYESLPQKLSDPKWAPDFGEAKLNPRFGATVIGARNFLLAYNVSLNTVDTAAASEIAARIRESGRGADANARRIPGRLKSCKAIGWYMPAYGCAQVSMNLTDFQVTGLFDAFRECAREAGSMGLRATGSELIGLVPKAALVEAGRSILRATSAGDITEEAELIRLAVSFLGLSQFNEFKPDERIIERLLDASPAAEPQMS